MNIGIPKEIRPSEYRVGLSPAGVQILSQDGHICYIENEAGLGAGFTNENYERAGGRIAYSAQEVYGRADVVLKVARPKEEELDLMQDDSCLLGFLHLTSARQSRIDKLLAKKITALSYDQIQLEDGSRPVKRPLSEIGGRMTAQVAARLLQNNGGGKGILLGGMPGVPPAEVTIIGAGVAGRYAAKAFLRMGAQLTVLDTDPLALQNIHDELPQVVTMLYTRQNRKRVCEYADVLVTAAATPGERAPILIRRGDLKLMKARSLVMDISIDQGGNVETSRPTSHANSTFVEEGIVHYCVPNMPGVAARTATHAFFNAGFSYIQEIVQKGIDQAIQDNPAIEVSINTYQGEVRNLSRIAPKDIEA
ncbi:MAG: alanine dehydrogenase [Chloroflexi bacterium]|nr:MAG: alanine dehydrogenase [Chloroflexota bacterium]MBL1194086.1 alanine dehydrogenase [Chloroflexota bacterium]NOH11380.1 alanine dehydrogenase [Chloroflexota bacterium]